MVFKTIIWWNPKRATEPPAGLSLIKLNAIKIEVETKNRFHRRYALEELPNVQTITNIPKAGEPTTQSIYFDEIFLHDNFLKMIVNPVLYMVAGEVCCISRT